MRLQDIHIIDTHFHIWDRELIDLEWVKGLERLDRDFSFEYFMKEYDGLNFVGGIFIEVDSKDSQKELSYIQNIARQKSKLLGYVANSKESKNIPPYAKKLCGFREVLHTQNRGKISHVAFHNHIKDLKPSLFEVCILQEDIPRFITLAGTIPHCSFVLNHMGNPIESKLVEYEAMLKELGALPNVFCKLSSLDSFSENTSSAFIDECIKLCVKYFKAQRLLFGSNYPVSQLSPKLWAQKVFNTLKDLDLDKSDIKAIFSQNAYRIYGIRPAVQRFGQIIGLKPDSIALYERLHANAWSGVLDTLQKANIQNYSIYRHENTLFAYFEYSGNCLQDDLKTISQCPITQEWWKLTDACQIPLGESGNWLDLKEVFHLD